jgi:hypothetical protein
MSPAPEARLKQLETGTKRSVCQTRTPELPSGLKPAICDEQRPLAESGKSDEEIKPICALPRRDFSCIVRPLELKNLPVWAVRIAAGWWWIGSGGWAVCGVVECRRAAAPNPAYR